MGCALALQLVAGLVHAASAGGELALRAEGRSTTLSMQGAPDRTREAASATPAASAFAESAPLRLGAAYAPRIWTSDLGAGGSPFVNHTVEAHLATLPDTPPAPPPEAGTGRAAARAPSPWRGEVGATAVRGRTDPLADLTLTTAGNAQLASTASLRYEELRAAARAEGPLDPRTTLAASATYGVTRPLGAEASAALPPQRGAALEGVLGWLASERDTLGADVRAGLTLTGRTAERDARTALATALATWVRRLSPQVEARAGAGLAVTASDDPSGGPRRVEVLPSAELGASRDADERGVSAALLVRLTTLVDRFTGDPRPMADATLTLGWTPAERLAATARGFAGARTDGETAVGGAEVRLAWTLRERLSLEGGVRGRWQHERRPVAPSFLERAVFLGLSWSTGPVSTGAP